MTLASPMPGISLTHVVRMGADRAAAPKVVRILKEPKLLVVKVKLEFITNILLPPLQVKLLV